MREIPGSEALDRSFRNPGFSCSFFSFPAFGVRTVFFRASGNDNNRIARGALNRVRFKRVNFAGKLFGSRARRSVIASSRKKKENKGRNTRPVRNVTAATIALYRRVLVHRLRIISRARNGSRRGEDSFRGFSSLRHPLAVHLVQSRFSVCPLGSLRSSVIRVYLGRSVSAGPSALLVESPAGRLHRALVLLFFFYLSVAPDSSVRSSASMDRFALHLPRVFDLERSVGRSVGRRSKPSSLATR